MSHSQTITLVTDVRGGEPDILIGNEFSDLVILQDGEDVIGTVPAPDGGWTHTKLILRPELTIKDQDAGHYYDALLGSFWIGSTEV